VGVTLVPSMQLVKTVPCLNFSWSAQNCGATCTSWHHQTDLAC
jgi:hypothetical protein